MENRAALIIDGGGGFGPWLPPTLKIRKLMDTKISGFQGTVQKNQKQPSKVRGKAPLASGKSK